MRTKMILLSLLSILIVAISWLMNFGFIRLLCSVILIPFVHAIIVFAICAVVANYAAHRKIKLYNFLFCITYILSNIFFPDVDGLANRMFFGLIENEFMCKLGGMVSIIALIMNIFLLVLQIIEIIHIDKTSS